MRDRTRSIVAVVIALVGFVWILQGLGLTGRTGFMDGNVFWAYAGGALVIVALLFGWRGGRASRGGR